MIRSATQVVLAVFIIVMAIAGAVLVWYYGNELLGSQLASQILFTSIAFVIFLLQVSMFVVEANQAKEDSTNDEETSKFQSNELRIMVGVLILSASAFMGVVPWFWIQRELACWITFLGALIAFLEVIVCIV